MGRQIRIRVVAAAAFFVASMGAAAVIVAVQAPQTPTGLHVVPPTQPSSSAADLQRRCNELHHNDTTGIYMVIEGDAKPTDRICHRATHGDSLTCETVADQRKRLKVP